VSAARRKQTRVTILRVRNASIPRRYPYHYPKKTVHNLSLELYIYHLVKRSHPTAQHNQCPLNRKKPKQPALEHYARQVTAGGPQVSQSIAAPVTHRVTLPPTVYTRPLPHWFKTRQRGGATSAARLGQSPPAGERTAPSCCFACGSGGAEPTPSPENSLSLPLPPLSLLCCRR
jgi:hypothetical protein